MHEKHSEKAKIQPRLLTVNQTASYLAISPRTIYNQIAPAAIKKFPVRAKRVGGVVRFDIRDLEEYVNEL